MPYGESTNPEIERIARAIVDCAFRVHTRLGPGLLESVYEACLAYELRKRGFRVKRQLVLPIAYDQLRLEEAYRIDLLVNDLVLVGIKAVERMEKLFLRQTRTYLRLAGLQLGLLINFNVSLIKDGLHRVITSDRNATSTQDSSDEAGTMDGD